MPAVHAQQQDIDVTAEVDKTELAVGEEFTLWIKIDGALNPRQPAIPNYDGIRRLGPPSIQWVRDGTGTTVFAYVYRFEATKVGKVTIEPISVTVSGQTLSTEQVEVEVFQGLVVPTPGPGQGQPSSDDESSEDGIMFVTASIDDDKPYLGQQVTYTFKFYRRSVLFPSFGRFGQPRYAPPGFSGFWNGQETDQDEYTETIGSNRYQVVELQTVLFPTVVGTLVIEPAGLTVPIDFFESPNFLETDPIVIEVQPLPPTAPAGFTGAVGSFDISAEVDNTNGKLNEPVQLTVRVEGEGNVETLPDPAWPDFEDWRVFESPSESSSSVVDGQLVGTRTYESVLVPEKAGVLTVPEIGYTFYDPSVEEYVEAVTEPIVMSIAEADGMSPLLPSPGGGNCGRAGRFRCASHQARAVYSSAVRQRPLHRRRFVYWAAWGVSVCSSLWARWHGGAGKRLPRGAWPPPASATPCLRLATPLRERESQALTPESPWPTSCRSTSPHGSTCP